MPATDLVMLKRELKAWIRDTENSAQKAYLRKLLAQLESGIEDYEEQLEVARMIGARNPAFSGDEIGYLDDDFSE